MTCEILSYLPYKEIPVCSEKQYGICVEVRRNTVLVSRVASVKITSYVNQFRIFL